MHPIVAPLPDDREPAPNRVRWTRTQCKAIQDAGILNGRYELIDGEILSKMGQNPAHAFVISLLIDWLVRLFGGKYVRIQSTIDLSEVSPLYDEPEPDAVVTVAPNIAYLSVTLALPTWALVVEVSDTTLRFDRTTKAALYARAGIREYWIVDITGRQIPAHRQPTAEGYAEITAYTADESVATLALPNEVVRVADLLPPLV